MRRLVILAIPAVLALSACGADPYNTGDCGTVVHHHVIHHTGTHRVVTRHQRVTIKSARRHVSLSKSTRKR
jgi:hypothetical protein